MNLLKRIVYLAVDSPFRELLNEERDVDSNSLIPNTVYQTWESRRLPRRLLSQIMTFRKRNPTFSFFLLDREERDAFMKHVWGDRVIYEVYSRTIIPQLQVDIFRYCLLFSKGGWYFDINKCVRIPMSLLIDNKTEALVTFEGHNERISDVSQKVRSSVLLPDHYMVQWGLAFKPMHKILEILISSIESNFMQYVGRSFCNPKKAIIELTGPIAYTRAVHKYVELHSANGIKQLGIDFEGAGVFSMKGSGARYLLTPNYAKLENSPILI